MEGRKPRLKVVAVLGILQWPVPDFAHPTTGRAAQTVVNVMTVAVYSWPLASIS